VLEAFSSSVRNTFSVSLLHALGGSSAALMKPTAARALQHRRFAVAMMMVIAEIDGHTLRA